jgi:hypothetical protein
MFHCILCFRSTTTRVPLHPVLQDSSKLPCTSTHRRAELNAVPHIQLCGCICPALANDCPHALAICSTSDAVAARTQDSYGANVEVQSIVRMRCDTTEWHSHALQRTRTPATIISRSQGNYSLAPAARNAFSHSESRTITRVKRRAGSAVDAPNYDRNHALRTVCVLLLSSLHLLPVRQLEPPIALKAVHAAVACVRKGIPVHAILALPESAVVSSWTVWMDVTHMPFACLCCVWGSQPAIPYCKMDVPLIFGCLRLTKLVHRLSIDPALDVRVKRHSLARLLRAELGRGNSKRIRHQSRSPRKLSCLTSTNICLQR